MPFIRLPVCGDLIDSALITGLSANGVPGEYGVVTVWIAEDTADRSGLSIFTQISVSSLIRAQQLRDQIIELCELEISVDAYDPEDPESDGGGGQGLVRAEEEDDPEPGQESAPARVRPRISDRMAREILESWEPASKQRN